MECTLKCPYRITGGNFYITRMFPLVTRFAHLSVEYLRRDSERGAIIPPPDDQKLVLPRHWRGRELSQWDKTVEFYDLHEGSTVRCGLN
jgi:hypothetical protein